MPDWVGIGLGVVGGTLLLWLTLIGVLWVQQRRTGTSTDWRAILRLVPDVIRLLRGLVADSSVPRATRWWLVGLLGYLLLPFDLVPDFIPVLGIADDAIIVAIVLRFAIRHAGMDAVKRHWLGSTEGLTSVLRLAGLTPKTPPSP
jgi:uncharacterized membrane protein YkvA (DUF1232 family)